MMRVLKCILAGIMTFLLTAITAIGVFAATEDTGFSDVDANAWYADAVIYCRDNGLMSGTSSTAFSPDAFVTRDMLAAIFYRMAGSPAVTGTDNFTDTLDGAWYANAVKQAAEKGIIDGYGNNIFGVGDAVTKEQMLTILWRYAGSPEVDTEKNFADESDISSWANAAVDWADSQNYMPDTENNYFHPKENATRAEVAFIFMKYLSEGKTAEQVPDDESEQKTNVLIAYFSCTGNTEAVAKQLNTILEADVYEIIPEIPYTDADLNYGDDASRTSMEMNDRSASPAISGSVENMAEYDIIFLGYTIWWRQKPKIMNTFVESYDFNGKTIIPFCTSGSSSIGSSADALHDLTEGAAWLDGQRFSTSTTESDLREWVNGLEVGLEIVK